MFTKIPRIIVVRDVLPSSFNLKRGILPPRQKLTWRLLVIPSQKFPWELNSSRIYYFQNIPYLSMRLQYILFVSKIRSWRCQKDFKNVIQIFSNQISTFMWWEWESKKNRLVCQIFRSIHVRCNLFRKFLIQNEITSWRHCQQNHFQFFKKLCAYTIPSIILWRFYITAGNYNWRIVGAFFPSIIQACLKSFIQKRRKSFIVSNKTERNAPEHKDDFWSKSRSEKKAQTFLEDKNNPFLTSKRNVIFTNQGRGVFIRNI